MSEATPEPDAEPSLWVIDPEDFGPADIEGNPPEDHHEDEAPTLAESAGSEPAT